MRYWAWVERLQEDHHARVSRKRNKRIDTKGRFQVFWLAQCGRCVYCGAEMIPQQATWDHIKPRSRGGTSDYTNLVLACGPCNAAKGAENPATYLRPDVVIRLEEIHNTVRHFL